MKFRLFIFCLLVCFTNTSAQQIIGDWTGNLEVQGMKLPINFHFFEKNNALIATMDSPMQGAKGIAVDKATCEQQSVHLEISNFGIVYKGNFYNDSIRGTFTQRGMTLPLILVRKNKKEVLQRPQIPKPPFSYVTEEVKFKNEKQGNWLAGTLCVPSRKKDFPIVVMITGSGAQNRDEEIFGHKPFWVLADYLAKNGVGSLRMDDRGVGGSELGKANPTTVDFATDIETAVDFLAKSGYTNIGLLGHSEGGMIAPMVATQDKRVKFMVLLAAPGIPCSQLLLLQNEALAKAQGISQTIIEQNSRFNKAVYEFVRSYKGNETKTDLQQFLSGKLSEIYEGQLTQEKIAVMAQQQTEALSSAWIQYFIKYNPEKYLVQIQISVLAINGSLDLQVSAKENLQGIKKALEKAGNANYTIKEFKGLNHLFQYAKTGLPSEYGQLTETLNPEVLECIAEWVNKQ